jgi:hypothetical protein
MRIFSIQQQTATLRRLCELLMPPLKGYPGALEAGTPEFLDFLIGASPRRPQQMYLSGLDWLDAEAKRTVRHSVCERQDAGGCSDTAVAAGVDDGSSADGAACAFHQPAHSDIRTATINSQEWSDAQLAAGKHSRRLRFVLVSRGPGTSHEKRSSPTPCCGKFLLGVPSWMSKRMTRRFEESMSEETVDVLIIGSGHSGGMAAKILTEKGISCLMLNAGPVADVRTRTPR